MMVSFFVIVSLLFAVDSKEDVFINAYMNKHVLFLLSQSHTNCH